MVSGPADTGKTISLCWKLDALAKCYPGCSLVIARKQRTDLYSTVIETYKKRILRKQPVNVYGGEHPEFFEYPNGSRIWCAGLDKPGKVLSSEHDVIYVNQAEEISLIDWETITTRVTGRAGHMPYSQALGDCNPSSPNHWIPQRAKAGALTLIPTTHRDNPELYNQETGEITPAGIERLGSLKNLTGSRLQRLYYGLWSAPEGAIYELYDDEVHKCAAFNPPSTWPRFVGIDPAGAYRAAVWGAYDPQNKRLNIYREHYMPFGHPVKDFVADLFQMSGYTREGRSQAGAESIFGWCCGAKSERDWRAEFLACGLPVVEPPVTDVWVGIDAINDLFKSQRLVIHDCCPQLLAEIPDYRRVRARDGYFTDNIEDKDRYHCLVGDSSITTKRGDVPIKEVIVGDSVLTRKGWRSVLASGCTSLSEPVYTVLFSNGIKLVGTSEHPVWVKGQGYIYLLNLRYGDIILTLSELDLEVSVWQEKRSSTLEELGGDIRRVQIGQIGRIIPQRFVQRMDNSLSTCIGIFGSNVRDLLNKGITFITRMATWLTTILKISKCLRRKNILTDTYLRSAVLDRVNLSIGLDRLHQPGIGLLKDALGILSLGRWLGRVGNRLGMSVSSAGKSLSLLPDTGMSGFVQTTVSQQPGEHLALTMKRGSARSAGRNSLETSIPKSLIAPVFVLSVTAEDKNVPVYNLEIEDEPEFFANGILVHNSADSLRYLVVYIMEAPEEEQIIIPYEEIDARF